MHLHALLLFAVLELAGCAGSADLCLYYQEFVPGQSLLIFSPNYPRSYPKGVDCIWEAVAPSNSKFILNCSDIFLPEVSEMRPILPSQEDVTALLLKDLDTSVSRIFVCLKNCGLKRKHVRDLWTNKMHMLEAECDRKRLW
jgi:hypothetical protein